MKMGSAMTQAQKIELKNSDLTRNEKISVRQLVERSGKSFEECLAEVINRRPVVTQLELVIGSVINAKGIDRIERVSQEQSDEILKNGLKEIYGELGDFRSRLIPNRFTISGTSISRSLDDVDGALSIKLGKDFEEKINNMLDLRIPNNTN